MTEHTWETQVNVVQGHFFALQSKGLIDHTATWDQFVNGVLSVRKRPEGTRSPVEIGCVWCGVLTVSIAVGGIVALLNTSSSWEIAAAITGLYGLFAAVAAISFERSPLHFLAGVVWAIVPLCVAFIGALVAARQEDPKWWTLSLSAIPALITSTLIMFLRNQPLLMICVALSLLFVTVVAVEISSPTHNKALRWTVFAESLVAVLSGLALRIFLPFSLPAHRTYLVDVFSVPLFLTISDTLNILDTMHPTFWLAYFLCMLCFMITTLVARAVIPLVLGLCGVFFLVARLGAMIDNSLVGTALKLLVIGATGALMVVVGILYNRNKRALESKVDNILYKLTHPSATRLP